jgi:hypothetical protein
MAGSRIINISGSAQECQGRDYQQWVSGSPYQNNYNKRRVQSGMTTSTTYRNPRSDNEITRVGDDPPKGNNKPVQADSHKQW